MIRTLIVSGGNIGLSFFKELISNNEYNNIIASDKGLEILDKCKITPNYIIGDFDSIDQNILNKYINNSNIKIIKLNPIKDYTDTHMALKLAIDIKSLDITIIGAIGTRVDHLLGNIHVLKEALDKKISCKILNENNKIYLLNRETILKKEIEYPYISLIPLTTTVEGITLNGFKYNLNNEKMYIGQSLGVSNEQIEENAIIKIEKGILIIIKSKD
ncbi:MAG: thiamine diphosphokinase [Clostridia bacterium]|nr:thiamine diphosphokinase [Clostridia bacterium]